MTRVADDGGEGDQPGDLQRRQAERQRQVGSRRRPGSKQRRQQHQHDDGEQVLDDEPADGDVAGGRVQVAVVGEHADEHHRAGHRQRDSEDDGGRPRPAEGVRDGGTQQRRGHALRDRARHGDAAHGQQLVEVELQPDAEHQEDDADLGQLFGQGGVGHKARRVRADEHAGQQVSHQRREPDALGDVSEDQRRREPAGDGGDEIESVHLSVLSVQPRARAPGASNRRPRGPILVNDMQTLPFAVILAFGVSLVSGATAAAQPAPHPRVVIDTEAGQIEIELDATRAPRTVANFLRYVDEQFFDGTSFYRTVTQATSPTT